MYKCRMTAYEGKEPYIFISYAHKDSEKVLPILDMLSDRGYRIWYDDGIAPGSEWPEYIAEHLNGSTVTLAFVSSNSVASPNCRREINFALGKNKSFVAVMLEKTNMSLGMELQLSSQQCVFRENFATDDAFVSKLCLMKELEQCKAEPKPVEDTKIKVGNLELDTVSPVNVDSVSSAASFADSASFANAAYEEKEAVASKPVKEKKEKVKKEKPAKAPSDKKPVSKPILFGSIGGGIVLVVLLIVIINAASHVTVCGKKYKKSEDSLYISRAVVTSQDFNKIGKMKKLRYLTITDSEINSDISKVANCPALRSIDIEKCTGNTDYSFVASVVSLANLDLIDCGLSGVLVFDNNQEISRIQLSNNPGLTDVSGLNYDELIIVDVSNTGFTSVEQFTNAEGLSRIEAAYTGVTDINCLADLRNLTSINFEGCKLQKITKDFLSLSVKHLNLSDTGITDLTPFNYMTVIEKLWLSNNNLSNIVFLDKCVGTIKEIYVAGNNLDAETIASIGKCFNAKIVNVSGNKMTDLSICDSMTELEEIYATGCGLASLKGLAGKTNLSVVVVNKNDITDVSGLEGSMQDAYSCVLDLRETRVSDLSKIPAIKYSTLLLNSTSADLSTVPAEVEGYKLSFDYSDEAMLSQVISTRVFSNCYIVGMPLDKELTVKEIVGSYSYNPVDANTIDGFVAEHGYTSYDWN